MASALSPALSNEGSLGSTRLNKGYCSSVRQTMRVAVKQRDGLVRANNGKVPNKDGEDSTRNQTPEPYPERKELEERRKVREEMETLGAEEARRREISRRAWTQLCVLLRARSSHGIFASPSHSTCRLSRERVCAGRGSFYRPAPGRGSTSTSPEPATRLAGRPWNHTHSMGDLP